MIIDSTPQVIQYLAALGSRQPTHLEEIKSLRRFLEVHRHGATVPEVRWKNQQSKHFPLIAEVRASDPFPPYRILFIMDSAETRLLYLWAGNKGVGPHQGNDWYDAWVPVADAFVDQYWPTQPPSGKI
jgi:hypothetical protein